MDDPGRFAQTVLADGRVVDYWDGGDPDGRLVVYHPGTPSCRVLGVWADAAASAAGVRLVSVSRPGYGDSTPLVAPSLLETGRLTAALVGSLDVDDYAVVGVSGGGPYAVATAGADPDRVRSVAVVAGIGPWTILDPATDEDAAERAIVVRFAAGDPDAIGDYRAFAEAHLGALRALSADERVRQFMASFASPLLDDPVYWTVWADNLEVVLGGLEGYVLDNLAWGAGWDVDLACVVAPTLLWYGDADSSCPPRHGEWYSERIAGTHVKVLEGERHLDMVDGHWPEVLDALLAAWA